MVVEVGFEPLVAAASSSCKEVAGIAVVVVVVVVAWLLLVLVAASLCAGFGGRRLLIKQLSNHFRFHLGMQLCRQRTHSQALEAFSRIKKTCHQRR